MAVLSRSDKPGGQAVRSGVPMQERERWFRRWTGLKQDQMTWFQHWADISRVLLPRNGRYFLQDHNRGQKRHNDILDSTATQALRVMAAGMMAGATSPARPWFRLGLQDQDLSQYRPVRQYLDDVASRMHRVFQRSNTYRALHQMYEELGAFGTAADIVLPNFDNVIHHYPVTVGEYVLQHDAAGRVCTFMRQFEMTVGALVKEFGIDAVSVQARHQFEQGALDVYIAVVHGIEPREDRDVTSPSATQMPWRSVYFELGAEDNKLLRESGFRRFPVLAPRWSVVGGDVYGHGPGMEALGDIRQLQHEQGKKALAIDLGVDPPLQVPTTLKNRQVETLPGGLTFVDQMGQQAGIRTTFETRLDLDHLRLDLEDIRGRIRGAFFTDVFLMLATSRDQSKTATEVAELHEEKMLILGPVLERLHDELLRPMVEMTFEHMLEVGALPPPPAELRDHEITPEFISMLAQAQRAIGANTVDRFLGTARGMAEMRPDVLDKVDFDAGLTEYADMLGVPARLLADDRDVARVRQARSQALAAKEQAAQMAQQAQTAATLAKAPTTGANALTDLMGQFSGYNYPQAGAPS